MAPALTVLSFNEFTRVIRSLRRLQFEVALQEKQSFGK